MEAWSLRGLPPAVHAARFGAGGRPPGSSVAWEVGATHRACAADSMVSTADTAAAAAPQFQPASHAHGQCVLL